MLSGPDVSAEVARALREVADELEAGDLIASRFEYERMGHLRLILRGFWIEPGLELARREDR